ncbi:MAG: serine/threonine protein kinase [Nocardioides sp.]|nr:serine/threonine protein kinase [Nocardioides sp.]
MPPQRIAGRYTVQRAVGHGGMGAVWLCHDEVLHRDVAVKQVGTLPGESTSDVNRALREARSSAALNHRNVVSVYDAVEDGEANWLVMEYVAARTLAQILAAEGSLSPERTAWIGAQAAHGLAAAHQRGTVHRDVKPGNIMVTDDDHVKIMDFGISRTHGDDMLTRTGLVIGTPSYLSPELARGEEPALPADVWALGATLYAAVEGHPLYAERANAISLITSIASEPAPPPQQAGFLTKPINRMLDRDPGSRWSMHDVAHSLTRLHEQRPGVRPRQDTRTLTPVPAADTTAADASRPTRERRRPVPVSVPVSVPADSRRRGARWLLPLATVLALVLVGVVGYALLDRSGDGRTPSAGGAGASAPGGEEPGEPVSSGSAEPAQPSAAAEPSSNAASDPSEPSGVPSTTGASATATDATGFVQDYYRRLPSDTRSAYDLLSPAYRASTTYGDYRGFWTTISAVSVGQVVESGDDTVDVSLTYTDADGRSQPETRGIVLEQGAAGYVIADDEVVAG